MLHQTVTVTIDRPLGSYHPQYPDLFYPINYGHVKGVIAPDGEEQDAYVLGIDYPIEEYTGQVIAIIHRKNDIENKWVVADINSSFSQEDIFKLTNFQEQYFDIEIIML